MTETNPDGHTVTYNNYEKLENVLLDKDMLVEVVNHKESVPPVLTGGLKVSKTVSGSGGSTSRNFTFTVELSDKGINGVYGEMTFKDGIASFTLKHGESKIASGLPVGIAYTVTESDNAGYTVTSTGDTGIVKAGEILQVMFENTLDHPEEPNLPQTGQLWWPVISLLGVGVLLVLLAIFGKKHYHGKHSA
ncbi:collagen binding protein [gut metagenome]|uniref:Collagen binding protein n=1 Tax=gut metagenome TaxID=749906 RepID=J9GTY0_9ZZZZ